MSTRTDAPRSAARRVARAITEALAPPITGTAILLALGWTYGGMVGLGWGAAAAAFACLLPYAIIIIAVRRGRLSDRMVTTRSQRLLPVTSNIVCAAAGLAMLLAASTDPPQLAAFIISGIATQAVLLAITTRWKISHHAGVTMGVALVAAHVYGPLTLAVTVPAVGAVCWSRTYLHEHTRAQVTAGALLGGPLLLAGYLIAIG